MMQVVYDIETYPNIFCLVAVRLDTDEQWTFEISARRNDLTDMLLWLDGLSALGGEMIGFNNLGFDYPVIHEIMVNPQCRTAAAIYFKAMSIIGSQDRFGSTIWPSDRRVPQLDMFKIHHFDNMARSTGLKALQFNMRSESVEDLPFPVGIPLAPDQMDTLVRYCLHDVTETKAFALKSNEAIDLRRALTIKYDRDFMNHNDTKIGKDYLIMCLGEDVCYTKVAGRRQPALASTAKAGSATCNSGGMSNRSGSGCVGSSCGCSFGSRQPRQQWHGEQQQSCDSTRQH